LWPSVSQSSGCYCGFILVFVYFSWRKLGYPDLTRRVDMGSYKALFAALFSTVCVIRLRSGLFTAHFGNFSYSVFPIFPVIWSLVRILALLYRVRFNQVVAVSTSFFRLVIFLASSVSIRLCIAVVPMDGTLRCWHLFLAAWPRSSRVSTSFTVHIAVSFPCSALSHFLHRCRIREGLI